MEYYSSEACPVLGVTATPKRHDEKALGRVFTNVAYEYWLPDAINDGWLVPISQKQVIIDGLSLDRLKSVNGDLPQGELDRIMAEEENLQSVAIPTLEATGNMRTLIFAAGVNQAERLVEIINRYKPGSARLVTGKTPRDERRAMMRDYAAGRFQYLVNVGVATEGFDVPGIECVVIARPTESSALFQQMVGRGTRPLPGIVDGYDTPEQRLASIAASAKPHLLLLDFTANSKKHELVSMVDVLGGKMDEQVVARARKLTAAAAAKGIATNPMTTLELAKQAVLAERKRQEARRARLKLRRDEVQYRLISLNPFDRLNIVPERERGYWEGKPLTPDMKEYLRSRKVEPEGLTYTQANQLIEHLRNTPPEGYKAEMATSRQKWRLRKEGLSYAFVERLTKAEASRKISEIIAANGGRNGMAPRR